MRGRGHIQAADSPRELRFDDRPTGVSTLRHYLHALWRRKWIALAPLVVIPLVTLVATLAQPDLYEASADVLVNRQEAATTSLVGQTPALDDADRTMETQVRLARVPTVVERTLRSANATGTSTGAFLGQSGVFAFADILTFSVSDNDAGRAATLADAYAREFVRFRRELDTAGLERTLQELRRQIQDLEAAGRISSPLYVRLADREQQLESLVALRTSNVTVVRRAGTDAEQVAPRPKRNTALALAVGLFVALVAVFLAESLSTRPRSDEEFEELLGLPLLGRVRLGKSGRASFLSDPAEADAFHLLRLNLELANSAIGAKRIMVTSPRSGALQSATAARLSLALVRAGRHVTLVDLDLRHSAISRLFGLDNKYGATSLARGECELAEAVVAIPVGDGNERPAAADSNGRLASAALLEIVGSGPQVTNPPEVLTSRAVGVVLAELRQRADVVLVDVPALLEAPDALAVAAHVDAVLVIVSVRDARGPTLAETRRVLESWPIPGLGFVLAEGGDERPYFRSFHRVKPAVRQRSAGSEQVT